MPVRLSWCFTDWTVACPYDMRDALLLPRRRRPVRAFSEAATGPTQLLPYRFPVQDLSSEPSARALELLGTEKDQEGDHGASIDDMVVAELQVTHHRRNPTFL